MSAVDERRVFVTGDRSLPAALVLGPLMVLVIRELNEHGRVQFSTGINGGVEEAMRFVGETTGLDVLVLDNHGPLANGKPDWDARHRAVADSGINHVYFVHADPMASSIGRSLMGIVPDDDLTVVS